MAPFKKPITQIWDIVEARRSLCLGTGDQFGSTSILGLPANNGLRVSLMNLTFPLNVLWVKLAFMSPSLEG
jgi:hypothetical protein